MLNAKKGGEKSLSQTVYSQLLAQILEGRWKPGTHYDRRSVAKELGVSIAPVSEAMIRLQEEGFLLNLPRKGTMLRPRDNRSLYENLVLREAIECQAIRMSYRKISEITSELREICDSMNDCSQQQLRTADALFHQTLAAFSGVELLVNQLKRIQLQVMFEELSIIHEAPKANPAKLHLNLIEDLCNTSTPDNASSILSAHIWLGRKRLFELFGNQ